MTATLDEAQHDNRSSLVRKSYWVGFLGSTIIVACSLLIAFMINHFFPLSEFTIRLLQAFSVVPGSAALFGVRGWDIQTWSGKTSAEILNQKLFTRLSAIGLFLPALAFSLMPPNTKDSVIEMELKEKIKTELLVELKNIPHAVQSTP